MGTTPDLGLFFTIESDPSRGVAAAEQAASAIGKIPEMTGEASRAAGAAAGDIDKSLIGPRESVRLLSEEFGLHLPRAVTGAIGQVLPQIAGLGAAMLGVFAVEELEKYVVGLKHLTDEYNGVAAAAKAIAAAEKENEQAMLDWAKASATHAQQQLLQIQAQITAEEAHHEQLKSRLDWEVSRGGALALLSEKILGGTKELQKSEQDLANLYKLRDELIKILGEDETTAHDKAAKPAEAHAKAEQHLAEFIEKERIKGAHEVVKLLQEQQKEEIKEAELQDRLAKIYQQGYANFELYTMGERNYHAMLVTLLPPITEATTKTQHLSAARKELIGVTQDVRQVEDAFKHALDTESNALVQMTSSAAGIGEQVAMLIGGKRAEAEVRGAFDVAMSIEEMAKFIASWGTDTPALLASIQYGLAAAEMFKVAGRGGGGRTSSPGISSAGGGGAGRGGERGGGGSWELPGAGQSSERAGTSITLQVFGHVFADDLQTLANKLGQGIQAGTIKALPATQATVTKGLI